ncbi:MAG: 16S rRNA (guanine(966)-N(2))-methyltransferase RsmD [Phycisphaerae bacterium]|jgi:16S rRNA (guanine966-N2)-methyltransferase|nr:16S rRNA (guanine(966)-N(2))-methyltransferase RsmD [Phycisphaerae bacterium]
MRILAGKFRGRLLLPPPQHAQTRPITGRAKKSLFDTLAPYLDEAVVLDMYSGTGTMGFEALSRGAGHCIFAEKDRKVIDRLKTNIRDFGVSDITTVWGGDIQITLRPRLARLDQTLDVVFVDPPYIDARRWDWQRAEMSIFAPLGDKLADDGLVALRTPKNVTVPETLAGLVAFRTKKYGSMIVTLLGKPEEQDA